ILATMVYPAAMLCVMSVVMGILFTVVVPKITRILADTGAILPWYTQVTIALSTFMSRYWWAVLAALALAVWGFLRWKRTPAGRERWDRFRLRAPIFGVVSRNIAVGRFARTLSTLLRSGVPLLTALDIVKNVMGNTRLAHVIDEARDAIREGESIAAPLKRSGEFPPLVYHMVAVGERSGQLEAMLENVAGAYERDVEMEVTRLTSLLAPIMILIMAIGVGFIVFSILIPIMGMGEMVQ
ncbi:MAG TPA: type II secretion system F family protein, partial [Polyangia bacterium]